MTKKLSVVSIACTVILMNSSQAQTYYGNGYTIIEAKTVQAGSDLDVTVYKTIQAKTVKKGLLELLKGSGWQLANQVSADPDITRLYHQNYPDFKRTLNPTKLSDALQYIAGDAWDLVVDPVNKLVSFQLSQSYRCFTLKEATCAVTSQP